MDLKLQRPGPACQATGLSLHPGEPIYSALVRADGSLLRQDWSAAAWTGPPDGTLAWWKSIVPEPAAKSGQFAPVDVLLDTLEGLAADPAAASLRYLLALQLVRRRVLRFADAAGGGVEPGKTPADAAGDPPQTIVFMCRRRDCEYAVVAAAPPADERLAVEERLAGLLWSGGEA